MRVDKKHTFIVIAAYNESSRITNVVKKLRDAEYKNIIITDDGSQDDTYDVICKLPIIALRHAINRGQGAALKTGIDYALSQGAEYIVTFDADGQHRVEDLPAMILPVQSGKYEITIGSRFLKNRSKIPLSRILTLKIAVLVQWIFYGLLLTDAHNGFRCFSRKAAKKIRIYSDRMEHASEIIEEIKRNRLKFKEVPVIILYNDDTLAKGHGGFLQGVKVFTKMLLYKIMR